MKTTDHESPSPAELAAFLRALGRPIPKKTHEFGAALAEWIGWENHISRARAELNTPPPPRVAFNDALARLKCSPGTLRDYWNEGAFVSAVEGDEGWVFRRADGFPEVEVEEMASEKKKRAQDKARKGALAKMKKK